ncbi:hypothetical protein EST38_g6968 [Candolleomyces aberdarensis]|uniref:ADF-H domain-containing protein n=1 Tax=Candolleomyces aberdarensis TaxID=2316362 RepID=A0A4Q2DIB7_9AGAR|nr:hypothetical protein EST38_g6968 [Candolleomyces aberdarensis]
MSAISGISPSQDLASKFAEAIESKSVRFIKASIQNESIVHDESIPISGSFEEDLNILQEDHILHPDTPAYVFVKQDPPSPDWLAIFYVPDTAKVRDKMLYASTRASLLKSLGSTLFTDSIFATNKQDLTPSAYLAHQRHQAAPKPLSSREQEIADLRVAENAAASYEEAEQAIARLAQGDQYTIVILTIDPPSETLHLHSSEDIAITNLASSLPASEPCYALLAWPYTDNSVVKREIVFIYSCPSSSPIKNRMLYSSGSGGTYLSAKNIIIETSSDVTVASRKIETSDPSELDEAYLTQELGRSDSTAASESPVTSTAPKPFAKPRGPGRRK